MVDQPTSRRSFLFGRRLRQEDPWLTFLARLKRTCAGELSLIKRDTAPLARLVPLRLEDVLHARALCREYGVRLVLEGVPLTASEQSVPVLLVEAGAAWANVKAVPGADPALWRVDAGCPIAVMRAMGILHVDETAQTVSPVQNFAQWLSLLHVQAPVGGLAQYGVQAVECLLPDGSIEVLGQFGVKDSQPLRSLAAQRAIPALFQLTMQPRLQALRQSLPSGAWPLQYRLDALMGSAGVDVNLAHLLLGHRASLGWIVAAHVRSDVDADRILSVQDTATPLSPESRRTSLELDQAVKQAMDPVGLFMSSPG